MLIYLLHVGDALLAANKLEREGVLVGSSQQCTCAKQRIAALKEKESAEVSDTEENEEHT